MPKKKPLTYAQKARRLREYGFKVAKGGSKSKGGKADITRKWKKIGKYVENTKQEFVFQKLDKREKRALRKGLNKAQFTPTGVFHRKPKGAKRPPEYKILPDGVIEYKAYGPKGGKVLEEIHPIDPVLLAEDPPKAILELRKRARKDKIILTVNGFNSSQTLTYDLDALAFYIANDLLPKFLDPNLDPAYAAAHGKKKRTVDDFVDTFHIKIIRHVRPKQRRGRKGK